MKGTGLYKIDGLDLGASFNYLVSSGSDDLLQLPESKEVYTYDWKGQNGKQYDLTKRFFDDKEVTFTGHIIADDKTEFWTKYLALRDLLMAPGTRMIYSFELEQTFGAFYLKSPGVKRFTRLQGFPDKIAMKLDLTFQVMFSDLEIPAAEPRPPLVNAGPDKIIRLPVNQVPITQATASARGSGSITTLLWTLDYTSPVGMTAAIQGYSTVNPTIFNLNSEGLYSFKLAVTDSNGLSAIDEMQITVLPEQIDRNNEFTYTFPYNLA